MCRPDRCRLEDVCVGRRYLQERADTGHHRATCVGAMSPTRNP
jgi:hypothetical protein